MCRSCFESFIRSGGTKTFVLNLVGGPVLEAKQDSALPEEGVREWVDGVWSETFGATTQAILKTQPFEFSAAGLADLDQEALRAEAAGEVLAAREGEGFSLDSAEGQQRALAVLSGYLN